MNGTVPHFLRHHSVLDIDALQQTTSIQELDIFGIINDHPEEPSKAQLVLENQG